MRMDCLRETDDSLTCVNTFTWKHLVQLQEHWQASFTFRWVPERPASLRWALMGLLITDL